jgi:hypothetical protein
MVRIFGFEPGGFLLNLGPNPAIILAQICSYAFQCAG